MANYLWKVMCKGIKNFDHLWNVRLFCILISIIMLVHYTCVYCMTVDKNSHETRNLTVLLKHEIGVSPPD